MAVFGYPVEGGGIRSSSGAGSLEEAHSARTSLLPMASACVRQALVGGDLMVLGLGRAGEQHVVNHRVVGP
jgi:hypothetical protein